MKTPQIPFVAAMILACAPVAEADDVEARVVPVIDGRRDLNKNGKVDPYEDWNLPVDERIEDLLAQMTLLEKIGQMSYPSLAVDRENPTALIVKDQGNTTTARHEVNNCAGFMMIRPFPSTRACAEGMNQIQQWAESTRLGIPLIMGIDPQHTQIYKGTKIVGGDRSLALSATGNLETVRKVYDVWRKEMRASGIHLLLGPQTDLTTDPRGIRNPDTPGEDAEWVYKMNQAIVIGFQGKDLGTTSALLCPKHFPGIGCTGGGHDGHQTFLGTKPPEGVKTGTPLKSTGETIKWHWMPFKGAIDAGTWAVMSPYYVFPGVHSETNRTEVRIVLEDWLRGELGFQGSDLRRLGCRDALRRCPGRL